MERQELARAMSRLSKLTGQDEGLVQAGGGNTSVKLDDRRMLVKASGFQLTDVTPERGYAEVDYARIAEIFAAGEVEDAREQEILRETLLEGARPSIETFLHAVTGRFTSHSHPLGVTMYAAREGGMAQLQAMFPEAVLVGYATPGIRLAKAYYAAVRDRADRRLIFLQNHGMIVSADTLGETIALQREVVRRVDASLGLDTKPMETGQRLFDALQSLQPGLIAYRVDSAAASEAAARAGGAWGHAFSPDCVVYCGSRIATADGDFLPALRRHWEQYGEVKAVLADGILFAVAENVRAARDIACMLDFTAKVRCSGAACELDDAERGFLLNWDAEKYRRKAN